MADEVKKLYRSTDDRWLGGICGGIGNYFNVDSTIIRVLFILFALIIGGGILVYIILWIIIPEEPAGSIAVTPVEEPAEAPPEKEGS